MGFPQSDKAHDEAGGSEQPGLGGASQRLAEGPSARLHFIRKVYLTLTAGLAVGGVGAFLGAMFAEPILASGMFFGMCIAELVFLVATLVLRRKPFWNKVLFFTANALLGATTGIWYPALAADGQAFVFWQAIGTAVAVFGGLTAYVFATRKDFSFLRGLLFTTCLGLFVVGLGNYFLGGGLQGNLIYQMIGLVMVCGFILYDTSNVLHHYEDEDYVAGALELAWDFWYLVFRLIMIFVDRD